MAEKEVILIGYSGHAFVVCDIFQQMGWKTAGYCDNEKKLFNPFELPYFGSEKSETALKKLAKTDYFIAIGDNGIRQKVFRFLQSADLVPPVVALHPSAVVAASVKISEGAMLAANVVVNPLAEIGVGAICNTGCIIEHECRIGNFAHIAPGAVLAGNVIIGEQAFVGANAVVKQGIRIGTHTVVGAGTVVIRDVPDGTTVAGNPARIIRTSK